MALNWNTMRKTKYCDSNIINYLLHSVNWSGKSDFLVDNKYTFEIGGKNKNSKQITGIENSFIAADNIEYAQNNKIPLWLFGFLY